MGGEVFSRLMVVVVTLGGWGRYIGIAQMFTMFRSSSDLFSFLLNRQCE